MAKRGFIEYKTYLFQNKDPVIDEVRTVVADSGLSQADIESESRVRASTMSAWFRGKTRRPQNATIEAVLRACGKQRVIVDRAAVRRRGARRHLKVVAGR
jgi:hypothetical protein